MTQFEIKIDKRKKAITNLINIRKTIQKEIIFYEQQGKSISSWGEGQKEAYKKISGALYHVINQMK